MFLVYRRAGKWAGSKPLLRCQGPGAYNVLGRNVGCLLCGLLVYAHLDCSTQPELAVVYESCIGKPVGMHASDAVVFFGSICITVCLAVTSMLWSIKGATLPRWEAI